MLIRDEAREGDDRCNVRIKGEAGIESNFHYIRDCFFRGRRKSYTELNKIKRSNYLGNFWKVYLFILLSSSDNIVSLKLFSVCQFML